MPDSVDFSGAPPLLIPRRLVTLWRGRLGPVTGEFSDLNANEPRTDYDRACAAAWPGRGVLPLGNSSALSLYTEFDEHIWDGDRMLVACGGWLPTTEELMGANWSNPLEWEIRDSEFLLMNSAADGATGLRDDDYLDVRLPIGRYIVEYADIVATYVGCFHRFTLVGNARSAA